MKILLTIIAIILLNCNYIFSAYVAGEISYKHISGYNYEINISTCKTGSPHDSILVYFGDGTSEIFGRIQMSSNSNYITSKYSRTHTYPGPGTYSIFTELINWPSGVNNIPNSSNVSFTLKTTLNINIIFNNNISPLILNELHVDTAIVGVIFTTNPTCYDSDADSLSYKLINCLSDNGNSIPGYIFPDSLTLDSLTGDLNWDKPYGNGIFAIAYLINEWRSNVLISQTMRQMVIVVKNNASIETINVDDKTNIYPNPTTGKIKINLENIKNVIVINEIGETVINLKKMNEVDLSNLSKGTYFIKVITDKYVQIDKLVFQ